MNKINDWYTHLVPDKGIHLVENVRSIWQKKLP